MISSDPRLDPYWEMNFYNINPRGKMSVNVGSDFREKYFRPEEEKLFRSEIEIPVCLELESIPTKTKMGRCSEKPVSMVRAQLFST